MERFCPCLETRTVREAFRDIADECTEFRKDPSRDELSDIAFGIGRLIGAFLGRPYVSVPLDGMHVEKIRERMRTQGCVRSARAIREGEGCK